MKKKNSKKGKRFPQKIFLILIIISLIIGSFLIINSNKTKIELSKTNTIEINSEVYQNEFINSIINGTIISEDALIDTSKLGKQTLKVTYLDNSNNQKEYFWTIEVIDTISPNISCQETITVAKGENIDILTNATVTDNSQETITPIIEGEYNLNQTGTYSLSYKATDSSQNSTTKNFTLIVKEQIPSLIEDSDILADGTYLTSKGYTLIVKDGLATIDGILIVNKTYSIPSDYQPQNPYQEISSTSCLNCLDNETMQAFKEMQADARALGLNIYISSGYRSWKYQQNLYNRYVSMDGQVAADTYSARPGHSEHQTGLAFDLNTVSDSFSYTNEGKWVANNCYKYGFILRYPLGKEKITGYIHESWHFRYVGIDLATKLYNNGNWLTLEEYYGLTSEYIA